MDLNRRELLGRSSALAAVAALPACAKQRTGSLPNFSEIESRTCRGFWDHVNRSNGLVPDRWPTSSFSSIAAVGFARLTGR